MALATILSETKTLVEAAAGVTAAQVHIGQRWTDDEAEFRSLMVDGNNRVNAWQIYRTATEEVVAGLQNLNIRTHEITIEVFYAMNDPGTGTSMTSEVGVDALVELVCTQLRQDFTLNSSAFNSTPPEIVNRELRRWRGVTCHRVEIRFEAMERVTYS